MKSKIEKAKQILSAYTNDLPEDQKWYQERLAECMKCQHNTAVSGNDGVFDFLKEKTIGPKGSCKLCGCPVDRKASVKSSVCALLEYENKPPKWEALDIKAPVDKDLSVEIMTPDVVEHISTPDSTFVLKVKEVRPVVMFKLLVKCAHHLEVKNLDVSCSCTTPTLDVVDNKTVEIAVAISTTGFKKGLNRRYMTVNYYKSPSKIKQLTIEFQTTI